MGRRVLPFSAGWARSVRDFDGPADTELSWELLGAYGDVHVATGPSPWDRDGLHGAEGPRAPTGPSEGPPPTPRPHTNRPAHSAPR